MRLALLTLSVRLADIIFPVKEFKNSCKRSGLMQKQSKNGKKWKRRFFILKDNYLFWWKSNKV